MKHDGSSVIVYGPAACGKTTNAERIRQHFGLDRIVDDWDPETPIKWQGVLYLLTGNQCPSADYFGSTARAYHDVMAAIDVAMPASPLLTEWISCTTPPVRDGDYEFERVGGFTGPLRCLYVNGRWTATDGYGELNAITEFPGEFHWRGVRRWVLTVPDFLMRGRAMVAHVSQRGVLYMTDKLLKPVSSSHPYSGALSFATEADAVAYATKHARRLKGWKAVLA